MPKALFESDLVYGSRLKVELLHDGVKQSIRAHGNVQSTQTWRRERTLGQGGFAKVYLQRCVDEEDKVRAVKKLVKHGNTDYTRELEAAALFSQQRYKESFVESFGWYESENSVYLTMEYLPLGDLARYMDTAFPEREARLIVSQLLEGLKFMHERDFTHRDLKPANIMVCEKGPLWWVKLTDFGISKRAINGSTNLRTQVYTPEFVAPEVLFVPSEEYTSAVDIWSLGVVAFLLRSGVQTVFGSQSRLLEYWSTSKGLQMERLASRDVTDEGQLFLSLLLSPRPQYRPDALACIRHPWLSTVSPIRRSNTIGSEASWQSEVTTEMSPVATNSFAKWTGEKFQSPAPTINSPVISRKPVPRRKVSLSIVDTPDPAFNRPASPQPNGLPASSFRTPSPSATPEMASSETFSEPLSETEAPEAFQQADFNAGVHIPLIEIPGHQRPQEPISQADVHVPSMAGADPGTPQSADTNARGRTSNRSTLNMVLQLMEANNALRSRSSREVFHDDIDAMFGASRPSSMKHLALPNGGRSSHSLSRHENIPKEAAINTRSARGSSAPGLSSDRDHNTAAHERDSDDRESVDGHSIDVELLGDKVISPGSVVETKFHKRLVGSPAWTGGVAYSHFTRLMASGSIDRTIKLWDITTEQGTKISQLEGHTDRINEVAFSPYDRMVVSGSSDGTIRLWDVGTGSEVIRLEDEMEEVRSVAISSDGRYIFSGSRDAFVRIWPITVSSTTVIQLDAAIRLGGHTSRVNSVAFSPRKGLLASGSRDKTVRIWSTRLEIEVMRLVGHKGEVHSVAFSPDGQFVASGSSDRRVRLWGISKRWQKELKGHVDKVTCVAFWPDELSQGRNLLVSGSLDGAVKVWDIDRQTNIMDLGSDNLAVEGIAFSPSGQMLISSSRLIRVWNSRC